MSEIYECPICMDTLTTCRPSFIKLKCNHIFHRNCITICNIMQQKCPICRHDIIPTYEVYNNTLYDIRRWIKNIPINIINILIYLCQIVKIIFINSIIYIGQVVIYRLLCSTIFYTILIISIYEYCIIIPFSNEYKYISYNNMSNCENYTLYNITNKEYLLDKTKYLIDVNYILSATNLLCIICFIYFDGLYDIIKNNIYKQYIILLDFICLLFVFTHKIVHMIIILYICHYLSKFQNCISNIKEEYYYVLFLLFDILFILIYFIIFCVTTFKFLILNKNDYDYIYVNEYGLFFSYTSNIVYDMCNCNCIGDECDKCSI